MITLPELAAEYGEDLKSLQNEGYGRHYLGNIALPPANGSACMGQVVSTWVYEWTDHEIAEYAVGESVAFLEDEGLELIDESFHAGDDGVLFNDPMMNCEDLPEDGFDRLRQETSKDSCDQPKLGKVQACGDVAATAAAPGSPGLHAVFQVGRLEVHIWLFNNNDPEAVPANALDVTPQTMEVLASTVADKADAVMALEPGEMMEPMIARIGDEEIAVPTSSDEFVRWEGEDFGLVGDEGDAKETRATRFGDAAFVYGMNQPFELVNEDAANYRVTLYRFHDDEAASQWMAGAVDRLEADGFYEDIETIDDFTETGDEVLAVSLYNGRSEMMDMRVYVRVGSDIAVMGFAAEELAPMELVEEYAAVQAGCLYVGYCDQALPIPSW